jgi:hypothetical protein
MTLSRRLPVKCIVILAAACAADAGNASILEEVLRRIDLMGSSPLSAIMVNLAENIATPLQSPLGLQPADMVIVGYAGDGAAVLVQAGPAGVTVSPELAQSMSAGLSAGLYPVGSQLYQLPPAGQISLYEESREGQALAQAQALLMSRIDGSITTFITGIRLPELAPAQLASVYDTRHASDLLDLKQINSTVLGAVNTGEVVTNVTAAWRTGELAPIIDVRLAEVNMGANARATEAAVGTADASSLSMLELGASSDAPSLVLNQATNGMAIAGQIRTIVQNQSVHIGGLMTTTIGAVNAGAVNPAP